MAIFNSPHSGRMPDVFYWIFGFSLIVTGAPVFLLLFGEPHPVKYVGIFFMLLTFLAMVYLMRYYQTAFNRLYYELGEEGVVINWGKKPVVIPYREIKEVSAARLKGASRIYGIELGGYRQGLFSIYRLGKGQFYAIGDQVVYIQTGDKLYVISPLEQEAFISSLRKKIQQAGIQFEERVFKNEGKAEPGLFSDGWSVAGLLVGIGMILGMALFIYFMIPLLPEQLPMHYNFRGEVDRFGPAEELYIMPGIALICWFPVTMIGIILSAGEPRIRRLVIAVADGVVLMLWGFLLAMTIPLL